MEWQTAKVIPKTVSPLLLTFRGPADFRPGADDGWSMEFQAEPEARVICNGRMPTQDEMIQVLQATNYPINAIGVFMVIARQAWAVPPPPKEQT